MGEERGLEQHLYFDMATIPAHFDYPGTPGLGPTRTKAGIQYHKGVEGWGEGFAEKGQ